MPFNEFADVTPGRLVAFDFGPDLVLRIEVEEGILEDDVSLACQAVVAVDELLQLFVNGAIDIRKQFMSFRAIRTF